MSVWGFQKQRHQMILRKLIENWPWSTIPIRIQTTQRQQKRFVLETIINNDSCVCLFNLLLPQMISSVDLCFSSSKKSTEHIPSSAIRQNETFMTIMDHLAYILPNNLEKRMSMHTLSLPHQHARPLFLHVASLLDVIVVAAVVAVATSALVSYLLIDKTHAVPITEL